MGLRRKSCSHADVLASGVGLREAEPLGPLGPLGCKGHFTKAAKTDSDIDFVLIFHVSTWVSLPLVGSRKLNRCTVLHLQSSFFLHRSMLNVSH